MPGKKPKVFLANTEVLAGVPVFKKGKLCILICWRVRYKVIVLFLIFFKMLFK